MKGFRFRFYIVMILATLSLVSVGFASWMVSENISESVSGLIVVEDVLKVNNFITCSSEDITKFSFFKTGFVNEDGSISTTGNITATIEINLDKCKSEFKDCNTLEVQFEMLQDDFILFNTANKLTNSVVVKQGENVISSTTTTNNIYSLTTFDIPITSGILEVVIDYTFEIHDLDYFKNTVYPLLLSNDFDFVLSAKLTGKKVAS